MAQKKTLANVETDRPVDEFIAAIPNKRRKADSEQLIEIIKQVTGKEPKVWGLSILGFGKYKYQRKNGDEFEWFNVGFSPGRARLTLYVMYDFAQEAELLHRLGPHEIGRGCLYIKKLEDVDENVLREMIAKSDRWERE